MKIIPCFYFVAAYLRKPKWPSNPAKDPTVGDNWVRNCLQDLRNSMEDRPPSENLAIVSDKV